MRTYAPSRARPGPAGRARNRRQCSSSGVVTDMYYGLVLLRTFITDLYYYGLLLRTCITTDFYYGLVLLRTGFPDLYYGLVFCYGLP